MEEKFFFCLVLFDSETNWNLNIRVKIFELNLEEFSNVFFF